MNLLPIVQLKPDLTRQRVLEVDGIARMLPGLSASRRAAMPGNLSSSSATASCMSRSFGMAIESGPMVNGRNTKLRQHVRTLVGDLVSVYDNGIIVECRWSSDARRTTSHFTEDIG